MKGYSELQVFQQRELQLFREATDIVAVLPERAQGEFIRCHEVARVVGHILGLDVIDGKYEIGAEHSWLPIVQKRGKYSWWSILDPYVVGRVPPVQLVAVVPLIPNRYIPGAPRDDIRTDVVDYLLKYFKENV